MFHLYIWRISDIKELYAIQYHFVIEELGHANKYFTWLNVAIEPAVNGEWQVLLPKLPAQNLIHGEDPFTREQIGAMREEEIKFDDDNKPTSENVPRTIIP